MSAIDYDIDSIGGNCPVQADVTLYREGEADRYGYFRARGASWSFDVYPPGVKCGPRGELPDCAPEWGTDHDWGTWPEAGWMEEDTARALIAWAIQQWVAPDVRGPPSRGPTCAPVRPVAGTPRHNPVKQDAAHAKRERRRARNLRGAK